MRSIHNDVHVRIYLQGITNHNCETAGCPFYPALHVNNQIYVETKVCVRLDGCSGKLGLTRILFREEYRDKSALILRTKKIVSIFSIQSFKKKANSIMCVISIKCWNVYICKGKKRRIFNRIHR